MAPCILITGASQGIGAAIAEVFARELPQARLVLVARQTDKLADVAARCADRQKEAGPLTAGRVSTPQKSTAAAHPSPPLSAPAAQAWSETTPAPEIFTCDVADASAVEALHRAVTERVGEVQVLINNAGVFAAAPLLETPVAEFDRLLAANLRSAFLMTRAFVPAMVARRSGDVFFMSSIAGLDAYPGGAAYCAAKFGVTGLAQVLRAETQAAGVRVCCVHPGATWSPSWSGSGVAPERIMPAEDVARAFFDIYRLSRSTVVEEIVLRPQLGDL